MEDNQRIDPAGDTDGAGNVLAANVPDYKRNGVKSPLPKAVRPEILVQRVTGDLGPIGLLARPHSPAPRVVIERHPRKAFVFVESPAWGSSDCKREFLDPSSPAIEKYAMLLAYRLRKAALEEQTKAHRKAQSELSKIER